MSKLEWPRPLSHLGGLPVADFLAEVWQRQPLLIRGALPGFTSPVSPDELAGLALEETVESRLVRELPAADPLASGWQLTQGPLSEDHFQQLPATHWSLLVQAVDQMLPEVAALLNRFRFLPNWRLDDVMISYAADQGSVGPHFDYYDVFLIQAHGKRRWKLGQWCDASTPLRQDLPLQLLQHFEQSAEYLLEPGDILYLPPQIAHWGIAEGECMTYSVGFRAPSYSDLLLEYSEEVAAQLSAHQRFSDAGAQPVAHPGEITDACVAQVQSILRELVADGSDAVAQFLGSFGTRAKRDAPELDDCAWPDAQTLGESLLLKPRVRAAFRASGERTALLYLDGETYSCSLALAQALSAYQPFSAAQFTESLDQDLLRQLVRRQWLWQTDGHHE